MQYIHKQGRPTVNGYKVHYNIGGETFYRHFGTQEYGNLQLALLEAQKFRDTVYQEREIKIENLIKKCRDIEFERGLKNKIMAGEMEEIKELLKKYDLQLTT
jgi:regulator of RNase E activity RraB